ncbi:hypothetical protein [Adhaeribacter rhizoryzae]|uniref:Type 1 periplasmic binding fold superfamily protein n=1 Tax=Adhaeribacter rhizoryzae TaxID=2607907 RepID=A0A5M6D4Z8_9BACT|nr:hypothetical protein [Adhaeribacter rhizoryzae]KAA5541660.1 hypothetical protein F0145_20020 [Adhaeribacter rhizoryzae]
MLTNQFNIQKKHLVKPAFVLLLAAGILSSCQNNDEDQAPLNESELITTVTLTMQEVGTSNTVTATFRDPDGEGGNAPTKFDEIVLKPNAVYNTAITLKNESVTPAEDITSEIEEEADDHQFFYTPTAGLNVTVAYEDKDSKNLPIGLKTKITTGAASTGKLKVTLKHQAGTKNNAITTGETDVELDFTTKVQ